MTTETTRHTSHGMRTQLVTTAADVISRAMQQGRTLPAALAVALESAQLLQSPDTAAEFEKLLRWHDEDGKAIDAATRLREDLRSRITELEADREANDREYEAATARIAELESERHATNEALSDAAEQLRVDRDRIAELEAELLELRPKYAEAVAEVARLVQERGGRMKLENALRDQIAELEAEAATQRRKGYQVAIDVMRQEKLPMSVGLLEAQLELEALDTPEPEKRPAGGYPLALPWAKQMDADDLEEFLADLTAAIVGRDGTAALDEVEKTCGTWRLIGEAQHAHNTAPGPDAETGGAS